MELSAWQSSTESWDDWSLLRGEEGAFSCLGFYRINLLGPLRISSLIIPQWVLQGTPGVSHADLGLSRGNSIVTGDVLFSSGQNSTMEPATLIV